jgi:hypothetical protein
VTLVAIVALAAAPRIADLADVRSEQAYQWRLATDLAVAVEAAGGADAVLECGRPFVGRLRGPLMAYRMDVAKRVVEPDEPPRPPGMVFRSALSSAARAAPAAPPQFTEVARIGTWQVLGACDGAAGDLGCPNMRGPCGVWRSSSRHLQSPAAATSSPESSRPSRPPSRAARTASTSSASPPA